MLLKTRGIVFHQFKYGENDKIVRIYTEERGLLSFILRGARSKKSAVPLSLFQNLSLLDLVITVREKTDLHYIKEATQAFPYQNIPRDIRKSTIILFLNEILFKTIREEETNRELFRYIFDSMSFFDQQDEGFVNFHLFFLVHLTKFTGFFPNTDIAVRPAYFDLEEGRFTPLLPLHPYYLEFPESDHLFKLLQSDISTYHKTAISKAMRSILLEKLLIYYKLHLPSMQDVKSLTVLQSVME
ncbi:MAG: DNA repair protein RecO [Bacteroidetes bacterium]|nr:DNA repair protein RecO [Bacteroidota bacterium]